MYSNCRGIISPIACCSQSSVNIAISDIPFPTFSNTCTKKSYSTSVSEQFNLNECFSSNNNLNINSSLNSQLPTSQQSHSTLDFNFPSCVKHQASVNLIINELRSWVLKYKISNNATNCLLSILKSIDLNVPTFFRFRRTHFNRFIVWGEGDPLL